MGALSPLREAALQGSKAVIARPLRDVERLAASDRELYPTFYGLTEAEVRLPFGDRWDRLRRLADEALFPGYKEHIRFAALSLDGAGLSGFGDCSLTLRDDMTAHRASVFEDNSASFLERHGYKPPPGCRALWEERARLCVAKRAEEIPAGTPDSDFPGVLLQQGSQSDEGRFVEVHVWGPMSIRTVERVLFTGNGRKYRKAFLLELRDRLAEAGATLEIA